MPPPAISPEVMAILEEVRREYSIGLPHQLRTILCSFARHREWGASERAQARQAVHKIAGSAATFGMAELSAEASALEGILAAESDDDPRCGELKRGLERFSKAANEVLEGNPELPTLEC